MLTGAPPVFAEDCPAPTVQYPVTVRFVEGAPRDRFHIDNAARAPSKGSKGAQIVSLDLDLSPSKGRLFFDTQEGGAGVGVFKAFRRESKEVSGGVVQADAARAVEDGADTLRLAFTSFPPGTRYSFSIDVDDRLSASELGQIRATGSEMENAVVRATLRTAGQGSVSVRGTFNADSRAVLTPVGTGSCR